MAKRFTDTEKWRDPWYRKLLPRHKAMWDYICCHCDNAGVWKPDFEVASFHIGEAISDYDLKVLNDGKERIRVLDNGNWWICDFVNFQFGDTISPKMQQHILKLVKHHKDFGYSIDRVSIVYREGIHTLQDKDKDNTTIQHNTNHKDKLNSKTNNKNKYVAKEEVERVLESRLGNIATVGMIKGTLRDLPENLWWMVDNFLNKRYPGGGGGFEKAQSELMQEKRGE